MRNASESTLEKSGTQLEERDRVRRCLAGDTAAWNELLAEVRPLVQTIARRDFRLSADDSEDVYQLISVKLYEHLGHLREPGAVRHWLRCIARRTIIDYLRARKDNASLDYLEETYGIDPAATLADMAWVDQATLRVEVQRALSALPEKYRGPVLLHFLAGEPQEEVSRLLGRPRSTVASQISRGLTRLRRSLAAVEAA